MTSAPIVGLLAALGVALLVLPASSAQRSPRLHLDLRRLALAGVTAVGAALVVHALLRIGVLSAITLMAAAVVPWRWRGHQAQRMARQQQEAWPDLIDNLVSALRAGVAIPQALVALADSAPVVLRPLVSGLAERLRAQIPLAEAIHEWREECADPVVDRIAMTLNIAVSIGGRSLPTVLANLATFLRVEGRTRAELVARQSWTVQAARLAVVAPWLMVVILGSRAREAYQTPTGAVVLIVGAIASALGYLWMTSVARLPRESRIFV